MFTYLILPSHSTNILAYLASWPWHNTKKHTKQCKFVVMILDTTTFIEQASIQKLVCFVMNLRQESIHYICMYDKVLYFESVWSKLSMRKKHYSIVLQRMCNIENLSQWSGDKANEMKTSTNTPSIIGLVHAVFHPINGITVKMTNA